MAKSKRSTADAKRSKKSAAKKSTKKSTSHALVIRPAPSMMPLVSKVTPTGLGAVGTSAALGAHAATLPLFLAFGLAATGIAVGTLLALDLVRPAMQAYGARLAARVAAGAATESEAAEVLRAKIEASPDAQRAVLEACAGCSMRSRRKRRSRSPTSPPITSLDRSMASSAGPRVS